VASKHIFITATDTDAGKTWVTAALIRSLLTQGLRAKALKPIACGFNSDNQNDDIQALLKAQNLTNPDDLNRYRFALPAAPSQAAAAQHQRIDSRALIQWCEQQANTVETCIIEGIGGLMTPITDTWLLSDWIDAMPTYEIWLVVNCKLGAINHTLLTLQQLKQMQRSPKRIFFNATTASQNAYLHATHQAIAPFLPSDCVIEHLKFGDVPSPAFLKLR